MEKGEKYDSVDYFIKSCLRYHLIHKKQDKSRIKTNQYHFPPPKINFQKLFWSWS